MVHEEMVMRHAQMLANKIARDAKPLDDPTIVSQEDFLQFAELQFQPVIDTLRAKGSDYTNGDPFENFRDFGTLGIAVRIGDKYRRLKNAELRRQRRLAVADETIEDTVRDIIGYCLLYLGVRLNEKYDRSNDGNIEENRQRPAPRRPVRRPTTRKPAR